MSCESDFIVPTDYQTLYDTLQYLLNTAPFDPPKTYKKMSYGLHLITASSGIEFWDNATSNDVYSDAPLHYNLETHKLMIDMIKDVDVDFINIRTRYPDNDYVSGSEEALHGAIQYAQSKGLDLYLMYIPLGLEHLHISQGNTTEFMTKYKDFIDEFVTVYKPKYFQIYDYGQIFASIGISIDPLIPEMYNYLKAASPTTLWIEAQGTNTTNQVVKFKYYCDSIYNDVMGIPLHDLYYTTHIQNLNEMVEYAKSKNRILVCPDCWLTDAHFDDLGELFLNTGWREPLDNTYINKVINIVQKLEFESINMFYGNHFISYNPGFFYPITKDYGYTSDEWVNCLKQGYRTSLVKSYSDAILSTKTQEPVALNWASLAVAGLAIATLVFIASRFRKKGA